MQPNECTDPAELQSGEVTDVWGVTSPGSLQDSLDLQGKVVSKLLTDLGEAVS